MRQARTGRAARRVGRRPHKDSCLRQTVVSRRHPLTSQPNDNNATPSTSFTTLFHMRRNDTSTRESANNSNVGKRATAPRLPRIDRPSARRGGRLGAASSKPPSLSNR
uniref:Uncharacterized protein n=1 Tax=Plectus sambesii TaxID=2011161 RepID=A0A914WFI2_9BILA